MKLENIDILYEDKEIIVCHKQAGVATQTSRTGEADMESALKNYLKVAYIGVVHRLDQPVEGILVFAKTKNAAAKLSEQNKGKTMCKYYCAVAVPVKKECVKSGVSQQTGMEYVGAERDLIRELGREYVLVDYLLKDGKRNISKVVEEGTPGAKRAELAYKIIKTGQADQQQTVFLEITLKTGRHHQIRVQLSNAGLPLLGDAKYGIGVSGMQGGKQLIKNIALCADRLEFLHPVTGKKMSFKIEPSGAAFHAFSS